MSEVRRKSNDELENRLSDLESPANNEIILTNGSGLRYGVGDING